MKRAYAGLALVGLLIATVAILGVLESRRSSTEADRPARSYRGSEPPGVNLLPRFELASYRGGRIRSQELRGRVVLTTFVDSACTDVCPVIVSVLARALPKLSAVERRQIAALAFSVNPASDTAPHIQQFLRARRALGLVDFLVGPTPQMRPIWRRFHILSAVDSGNADVHSADVRIFDRRGVWVSTLDAGADLTVANLLHDLRRALVTSQ